VRTVKNRLSSLIRDTSAATAVEYGLMAALVSVAVVGGVTNFAPIITSIFETIKTTLMQ
jgi:pilus assembly protein Flp/PilA